MDLPVIRHRFKKPHVYEDIIKQFTRDGIEPRNEEICVVGDRVFADIVLGNRHGFLTIQVNGITQRNENKAVIWSRHVEEGFLKRLARQKSNPFAPFEELKQQGLYKQVVRKEPNAEFLAVPGSTL